jgi:hypothetical protein
MYAKGITSNRHFSEGALGGIREFLQADGHEFVYHRFLVPAAASVRFGKALDRSVTGSMTDLVKHATYWLAQGNQSPLEVGFRLNHIPMSALASRNSPYGMPVDAFQALVGSVEA